MAGRRVCIVSLRGVNSMVGWCANYEFEDVVASVEEATIIALEPGPAFKPMDWVCQRLLWRPLVREFARRANPGLKPAVLEQDYDLLLFVAMNPYDLPYLNAVQGWRERCRVAVCYMVEAYAAGVEKHEFHLRMLEKFDHVVSGLKLSAESLGRTVGRPCWYLPFGVDALRFTPAPALPPRVVDAYSMGRRPEWVHEALLEEKAGRGLFYLYDTIPGRLLQPSSHVQHRELLAGITKRTRFFVAFPAKVDEEGETVGQSEAGARYYEGTTAGAVLLGEAPTSPAFAQEFDWPDAVLPIRRKEDVGPWFEEARREPARFEAISRRNAREGLLRHDWGHRWSKLLEQAGFAPTPMLTARLAHLAALASELSTSG